LDVSVDWAGALGLSQTADWISGRALDYGASLALSTIPSITFDVRVDQGVSPSGIPSEEAFGVLTFTLYLNPPFVPSEEALGTPIQEFVLTSALLLPDGIPSGEAFGTPTQSFVVDRL
jgi:hypothetical protein